MANPSLEFTTNHAEALKLVQAQMDHWEKKGTLWRSRGSVLQTVLQIQEHVRNALLFLDYEPAEGLLSLDDVRFIAAAAVDCRSEARA